MQAAEAQRRQTTGRYPSEDPHVRERVSETQRARWAERRAAGEGSGFTGSPSEFRRLIVPRLEGVSPSTLAAATGLSPGYCAAIRDGKRIPDVRHWAAFQLAGLRSREARASLTVAEREVVSRGSAEQLSRRRASRVRSRYG